MRLTLSKSREQIAELRRDRILASWPAHVQLEAHHDAANGKAAKLERMNAAIAAIKAELPYPDQ